MNDGYKTDFSKFPFLIELNELEITSVNINALPNVLFNLAVNYVFQNQLKFFLSIIKNLIQFQKKMLIIV